MLLPPLLYSQTSLWIRGGHSPITGSLGLELQTKKISPSIGWRISQYINSEYRKHVIILGLTKYIEINKNNPKLHNSVYLSLSYSFNGCIEVFDYHGNLDVYWYDAIKSIIGFRLYTDDIIDFRAGVGYQLSAYPKLIADITFAIRLFKTKTKTKNENIKM